MALCFQTASAAIIDNAANLYDTVSSSVLTGPLRDRLDQADDGDIIRVTIELKDDIDLDNVEQKAISRAKISSSEMAVLNAKTFSLSDSENEMHQLTALKTYDRVSKERNCVLKEYYKVKNEGFISSTFLRNAKIESVGLFTPFIRDVSLTKAEIYEIAKNPMVCLIDRVDEQCIEEFDSVNNTYKIVGGDTFINAGYSGSGIRVGLIEPGQPILSSMGTDKNNIYLVNSGITERHATMVSGIIKKFAPSCSIYSYATGDIAVSAVPQLCENMINNYSVHVINISAGAMLSGEYTSTSREMDSIIRNLKVPIVVAAGNAITQERHLDDGEVEIEIINNNVNVLGLAGNAITVGNAKTNGTNPDATGSFALSNLSCYNESSPINKPDICAPGYVSIYSYTDSGTSFATPHVTGTIVQMMARNAAFVSQPQTVKAALLASATRNCGTSMTYLGKVISNEEGAGVLDADFCYRVSRAGRATHFDVTSSFQSSDPIKQQVYCDYVTKPFRIACTWEVAATSYGESIYVSDYDVSVYKDGVLVASSSIGVSPTRSTGANCEIIEIPTSDLNRYGGGYYEVRIYPYGSFSGTGTVRIGLAWEQD